jgi:hypothetical protein
MKQYSKSATPQEVRMTKYKGQSFAIPADCNLKWPYHAIVIKTLDMTKRRMVTIYAFIS